MPASESQLKLPPCPESEYSPEFLRAMVARMAVSFHKYGPITEAYPDNVDAIQSLLLRLARYVGTKRLASALNGIVEDKGELRGDGNLEWLVDAGNFAMIEFIHPSHPKAHFRATSAAESPGRIWTDGELSQRANDLSPQVYTGDSK